MLVYVVLLLYVILNLFSFQKRCYKGLSNPKLAAASRAHERIAKLAVPS